MPDEIDDMRALRESIAADCDSADALAQKNLADGTERIRNAFAEGWTTGSIDQWLKNRQNSRTAPHQDPQQTPPQTSPASTAP